MSDNAFLYLPDDLRGLMADDGVVPSGSETARSLLWGGITLIRSSDPRAADMLRLINDFEAIRVS